MLCQCVGCPHPTTHLSRAHLCGKCNRRGHGEHECGSGLRARIKRYELSRKSAGVLPPERHCSIPGCPDPSSHESCSHHCPRCLTTAAQCQYPCVDSRVIPKPPRTVSGVKCPICRQISTVHLKPHLITGLPCTICRDRTKLCPFYPCGHVVVCSSCVLKIRFPGRAA